ncbi:MAG: peptidylprolyl isomerase [Chitinophagaceae bacterium]|nr:peptidylprolyl isomerase [Chitinophagaceae bacterium]
MHQINDQLIEKVKGKIVIVFIIGILLTNTAEAQKKTIAQIKTELEQSTNPPLYVKDVLKKKFVLDTVAVMRTQTFMGIPDSLAYKGKMRKVYGPYDNGKILVQILAKLPNTFNRISQIFIDTKVFTKNKADSLSLDILTRINNGSATFEDMASVWSMGGEAATRGDIGWIAVGGLVPEIEKELRKRKKGEVFRVWSKTGVHILRKTSTKEDTGFALMMRIFL